MVNEFIAIENIQSVINYRRLIPTIITWNRLEGRPRTNNFDRALKAEVRDALFMLTKQWQMGEFKGDDAGSPVIAKVHVETTKLNKYKAGGNATQGFENNMPLEAKVEQRMLPFRAGDQDLSLDIRLLMGRQWLKMINKPDISSLKKEFIKAYPIKKPDPEKREDVQICAHLEAWQQYAAVAERAMDGAALFFHLKIDSNNHAYDMLTVVLTAAQQTLIDEIAEKFVVWFEKLFYQPIEENKDAWLPSKLEYQFACSAPKKDAEKEKVFTAEEYYHGDLDWYNLNVNKSIETLGDVETETLDLEKTHTFSFFPTPIQFDGMPNTRWWTFEDGKTNFGDIKPDTTELNKQLLIEFGLVYANDWFLAPLTLPAGTIINLKGMAVTNVFGERIWIEPTGKANKQDWQRWNMYTLKVDGAAADEQADLSLLLLPTVPKIQESQPAEEVSLIRDEVANMVWGIETKILLPNGNTKPGREVALELKNHLRRIVKKVNTVEPDTVKDIEYKAAIKYEIMNTVPENWIPFIPVHVNGSNREIQLQRAAMPRIIEEDNEGPIQPRTKLLRFGLDQEPKGIYKLYEEEVPRSGVRVYQSYHRTRWYGGRVYNWLGVRKQVGRGEVSSGLAYDLIVPTNKTS